METWQNFIEQFPTRSYQKGEMVFLKDEHPKHFYIIKSGVVKTYSITSHGEEQLVSFDTARELFPLGWVFEIHEKTEFFYEAFTKCVLWAVSQKEYLAFLQGHPDIIFQLHAQLAQRMVSLQRRIHALQQPRARDKLVYTLLYIAERFGVRVDSSTEQLKLPITQQELASFVGLTRETISIELKKLETEGIIHYSRQNYYIHPQLLTQERED